MIINKNFCFYFKKIKRKITKQKKKVILIASMPRSGSTWLFNCVRYMHELKKMDFYSCWVEDYQLENPSMIHIVKIHDPDKKVAKLASTILSTRRDVRDSTVSFIRMNWLEPNRNQILQHIHYIVKTLHPFWNRRTDLEIEYVDIKEDTINVVTAIAKQLNMIFNKEELNSIAVYLSKLSSPKVFDPITQLHPEHRNNEITDYKNVFTQDLIEQVNRTHKPWLKKYKYIK